MPHHAAGPSLGSRGDWRCACNEKADGRDSVALLNTWMEKKSGLGTSAGGIRRGRNPSGQKPGCWTRGATCLLLLVLP